MGRKRKFPDEDQDMIAELQEEIKKLKSINRHLLKQIKKIDRKFSIEELEDYDNEPMEKVASTLCPGCARGQLKEVDLGPKKFTRCEVCAWRTKAVKNY